MNKASTFIKLNRNILNWRWYTNANTMRVFVHLLLKANIKDHDFEDITVHRGQLVTSRKHLSLELRISEQAVRTALNHLKSTNEITIETTSKYTIISIINYNLYQNKPDNQPTINQQSTSNQPQSKNDKKEKNGIIYIMSRKTRLCNLLKYF